MITPRDYQQGAVDSVFEYWGHTKGNPLVVAPCGSGKSIIAAMLIWYAMQYPNTRILIMTHRQELLEQDEAELKGIWPDAPTGFYCGGLNRKDRYAPILFASINTIHKDIHTLDPFDLVIIDEAHLIPRKQTTMYGKALKTLKLMNPQTRYVGLTATPYRLDSGLLHDGDGAMFDAITHEIPVRTLIERKHLCEVIGKRGAEVADLAGVRKQGGEFVKTQAQKAFDVPKLTRDACEEIVWYGQDRRAWLIFASGVQHAENIALTIRSHGIDCEVVHGGIQDEERADRLERFKSGRLRCLVNVDILTIGFNAPICDMGVLLRATASTALYVQIVGRLMRTYDQRKQNALLLDYGGNVERHGPIDDVNPKRPGKGGGDAPVKPCPECHSLVPAGAMECGDCGYEFPAREPKHERSAFGGPVMSHQDTGQWLEVSSVDYYRHQKPGKPDSVRVEYMCGLKRYKDWWLPEHKGKAKVGTVKKLWAAGVQCPRTTDELLDMTDQIPKPEYIYVEPERKYERVTEAHYAGERPPHSATA